jgi:hypothetical protein
MKDRYLVDNWLVPHCKASWQMAAIKACHFLNHVSGSAFRGYYKNITNESTQEFHEHTASLMVSIHLSSLKNK